MPYLLRRYILFFLSVIFNAMAFANPSSHIDEKSILDVAIVGGGISGLYAGYRLADSGQSSLKKLHFLK